MADEEDVLGDIDLDSFDFDDLAFENGTEAEKGELSFDNQSEGDVGEQQSLMSDALMTQNAEGNDGVFASPQGIELGEDGTSQFEEAFATEEPVAAVEETPQFEEAFTTEEPVATVEETPQFEEAFAAEEPVASVEETPQFEEAFATEEPVAAVEETPQFEEAFAAEEPVAAVEETPQFEEAFAAEEPVAAIQQETTDEVQFSENIAYLRWYSASSDEKMFDVSKNFMNGRFDADGQKKSIHVNVGYDTYGWSVQFFNGTTMNLRDVREYQIRNGKLPHSDGRIVYGKQMLEFTGVERIVIYESVKYFSYGI